MSIYTSLIVSRKKAMEIVLTKLATATNEELKDIAGGILMDGNRYNLYRVVDGVGEDDDKV